MMPMTGWPTANMTSAMTSRTTLTRSRSLTVQGALRQKIAELWTNLPMRVQLLLHRPAGQMARALPRFPDCRQPDTAMVLPHRLPTGLKQKPAHDALSLATRRAAGGRVVSWISMLLTLSRWIFRIVAAAVPLLVSGNHGRRYGSWTDKDRHEHDSSDDHDHQRGNPRRPVWGQAKQRGDEPKREVEGGGDVGPPSPSRELDGEAAL